MFLGRVELAGAGGFEAGDDHGVVRIVVQAQEAEVGQGAEAGGAEMVEDVIAAGGGDVVGAAGPGSGDPDQAAVFVGEGEGAQAVAVVLAGVVRPVRLAGAARWVGMRVPSMRTISPPRLAIFFRARSRRGAWTASRAVSSSRQRRTLVAEMSLPPAMSARRWACRRAAAPATWIRSPSDAVAVGPRGG
ncbi:hypothetical protein STTU_0968 [Streptomyces sp. Tu6071]|nr:hypothetical protein STTU_0968 [Streptomyces sp. Tu6071]